MTSTKASTKAKKYGVQFNSDKLPREWLEIELSTLDRLIESNAALRARVDALERLPTRTVQDPLLKEALGHLHAIVDEWRFSAPIQQNWGTAVIVGRIRQFLMDNEHDAPKE